MAEREIERKIADFRSGGIPGYVRRDGEIRIADRMVSVLTGVRRSGKSFRLLQAADEAVASGFIPSLRHVCPVDFDNPALARLAAGDLRTIQSTFLRLTPEAGLQSPLLFLLDEIDKVEGWEEYVIDLSRNPLWRVIVSGSSSRLAAGDMARALRGKAFPTVLRPLSFKEFLRFQGYGEDPASTKGAAEGLRLFDEYLTWGGYPAMSATVERFRPALLREYFDTMILRDIVERCDVSHPRLAVHLYRYLLANNAKPYTLMSAYRYLTGAGFAVGRDAVRELVQHAVDAWLLSTVPLYTRSLREQDRNYRKCYAVDWALANFNCAVWDGGQSRAFENMVYVQLAGRWPRVNYLLTSDDRQEVDFVASDDHGRPVCLVQACIDPGDESTLAREVEPLVAAADFLGLSDPVLVTRSFEKTLTIGRVSVRAVPAWRWMIQD